MRKRSMISVESTTRSFSISSNGFSKTERRGFSVASGSARRSRYVALINASSRKPPAFSTNSRSVVTPSTIGYVPGWCTIPSTVAEPKICSTLATEMLSRGSIGKVPASPSITSATSNSKVCALPSLFSRRTRIIEMDDSLLIPPATLIRLEIVSSDL